MPSTFSTLEIGKSALLTSRRAMDVTGHNIANASTPGYSRQRVVLEPIIQRINLSAGTSGLGVRVADVARVRDKFVDAVLRNEQEKKAAFAIQKDTLDHLQVVFAEPSDSSIRESVDLFWASWHDLSSDPQSSAARTQLLEAGRSLTDMFRHLGSQIDSLTADIEAGIDATVAKVNLLAERVGSLNTEISRALARKEPVGDLMDRRDLLLDEVTELTGATVSYLDEGTVKVNIGGIPLVDRHKVYRLESTVTGDGIKFNLLTGPKDSDKIELDSVAGSLGGHKTARDGIVLRFRKELNEVVKNLAQGVNAIHQADFEGTGPYSPFFYLDPLGADFLSTIKVDDNIIDHPDKIRTATGSDPLDGSIALAIADFIEGNENSYLKQLKDSGLLDLSDGDFTDKWMGIVGGLGVEGQRVESGYDTQELLVKELANRKDSISGVSLDEEIANLIREQHAFNAASRVISTADEMLDTIINRMGLGGR
ncbi:MAG: flagellar hook-associated protein FlgK [Bacillota bacterium]